MNLLEKINHLKQYPLSDKQMEELTGHRMLSYSELYQYDTLEHLLHINNGNVIIMYHQTETYGHYCCISQLTEKNKWNRPKFKKNEVGLVEFFDLYGLFPDKQLGFTNYEASAALKQQHTYLSYLMYHSPYKLSFNEHQFQSGKNVQTCGFHCAYTIINRWQLLPEYKKDLDSSVKRLKKYGMKNANYDDYVVIMLFDQIFNV